jgi:DNA-binding NarL/FixJ family response regulator
MERPWEVLIVEDDARMRAFLAACVDAEPRLALAGSVGTRGEALARLGERAAPLDAMLVDLGLPDGSGLDLIAHAAAHRPDCESIVVSVFGDEGSVLAAIEAGAVGYLHKDAGVPDVAEAVLAVKAGGSPISPAIARRVLARWRAVPAPSRMPAETASRDAVPRLSQRETEVLELIARGYSYVETARRQGVSLHTVQAHIKSLYAKLAVHSKSEAVYEASRLGLLTPPSR